MLSSIAKTLFAIFFLTISFMLEAQEPTAGQVVEVKPQGDSSLPYLLYLPEDYSPSKKYPLLVFLHGLGQRGDKLSNLYATGLPRLIKQGKHLPFIIVMPQCPNDGRLGKKESKQFWWNSDPIEKVKNILDTEVKLRSVDSKRIYATGLSMGGFGTYKLINNYPNFFAAAAPICGHDGGKLTGENLKHLPIWAFHGDQDKVVPLAQQQKTVDNYKKSGVDIKFTIYEGVAHNSWDRTYENPELYEWFLSHKK